jgi:molybdopterin-guanine dinucleotide biosynthesis protein A
MGTDKALLSLDGETLLARTVRAVSEVSAEVLLIGRVASDGASSARYLADDFPNLGPLGGLLTGLRRARYPYAAVVACDLPFLNADVLRLLLEVAEGYDAVVPRLDGRAHPTLAVYGRSSIGAIERQVARGDLSLRDLLAELRVRWLDEAEIRRVDPVFRSFRNVNTPRDWQEAQREAEDGRAR